MDKLSVRKNIAEINPKSAKNTLNVSKTYGSTIPATETCTISELTSASLRNWESLNSRIDARFLVTGGACYRLFIRVSMAKFSIAIVF